MEPPFLNDPKFKAFSPESQARILAEWNRRISADGTPPPPSETDLPATRYAESAPLAERDRPVERYAEQPRDVAAEMASTDPAFGGLPYVQKRPGPMSDAVMLASVPATAGLSSLGGVAGRAMAAIASPPVSGAIAGAGELRRSGSPYQALLAAATAAGISKGTGASGKLLKWFGKRAAAEKAAAEAAAQKKAVEEIGTKWQQMMRESPPAAPLPVAAPPVARVPLSSGTVPAPVPLRVVPPRMSAPARPLSASVEEGMRAEKAAFEAAKKAKATRAAKAPKPPANAAKPKAPSTPLEKAQSAIENDLKASIEMAKARAAGKPMRFEGPPRPAPDISNPEAAAAELHAYILKQHGLGQSKGQIADSLTQIYGLPDIPGPRGKKAGYWKDAVEMVLEGIR